MVFRWVAKFSIFHLLFLLILFWKVRIFENIINGNFFYIIMKTFHLTNLSVKINSTRLLWRQCPLTQWEDEEEKKHFRYCWPINPINWRELWREKFEYWKKNLLHKRAELMDFLMPYLVSIKWEKGELSIIQFKIFLMIFILIEIFAIFHMHVCRWNSIKMIKLI